jgi:hypothetical protein
MKKIILLLLMAGTLCAQTWRDRLRDTLQEINSRTWVPTLQTDNKINAVGTILSGELNTYVKQNTLDSVRTPTVKYVGNIANNTLDWGTGVTFYSVLQDTSAVVFSNVIEGKEITIVAENPSTYGVTFTAPAGTSIIWKDGTTPSQADSSVDVWVFNAIGNYILGERKGSYKLPVFTPPDTTIDPPVGLEFYVNSEFVDIFPVTPSKKQLLTGAQIPDGSAQINAQTFNVNVAKNEFEPFSFLVRPKKQISDAKITISNFIGATDTILSTKVDPYYYAVWWTENVLAESHTPGSSSSPPYLQTLYPHLSQEILVKDPALIQYGSTMWDNRIKGTEISTGQVGYRTINATEFRNTFKIQDATSIQTYSFNDGLNKQYYFIVKADAGVDGGTYTGSIALTFNNNGTNDTLAIIPVVLQVKSWTLPESRWKYGLYNYMYLNPTNYANNWYDRFEAKDSTQLDLTYRAMYDVGIRYPAIGPGTGHITPLLTFMNRLGFPTDMRFISGTGTAFTGYREFLDGSADGDPGSTQSELRSTLSSWRSAALGAGLSLSNTYFYGMDEATTVGSAAYLSQASVEYSYMANTLGMKSFVAISPAGTNYTTAVSGLSLPVFWGSHEDYYVQLKITDVHRDAALWEAAKTHVFVYSAPQLASPNQENYRRNYGFQLWKHGYTGAFIWKLSSTFGNVYFDDDGDFPDPMLFYPTYHGLLKTSASEGIREAVDDSRYMTKFLSILDTLSDATAKTTAETWLNSNFSSWLGEITGYQTGYPEGGISGDSLTALRDTLAGYIDYLIAGSYNESPSNWYDSFDSVSTLTIATAKISGTLPSFPVTLDLSIMPDGFWSTVSADGSDIAFSDNSNNKLYRYIAGFDKAGKKGVAYFKVDTLSDAKNVYKIWWMGSGESNSSSTFRSEYELVIGFNEDYNAVADYTGKHTLTFGTGRTSADKVAGKIGFAADFDESVGDTIRVGGSLSIGTGDLTLSAYTNLNAAATGYQYILGNGATSQTQTGYNFAWYVTTLKPFSGLSDGTNRQSIFGSAVSDLLSAGWKHVAFGLYRTAQKKWWVNGTADLGTTNAFFSGTDIGSATTNIIGGFHELFAPFYGQIDELRLYRGELSNEWMETEYNNLSSQATFFTIQ